MSDKTNFRSGICKEKDCQFATTNECYEGNEDITACPNFAFIPDGKIEDVEDSDNLDDSEDEKSAADIQITGPISGRNLYRGRELDYKSSLRITLNALTRVVVLAGANDTGKTTLLASIYENFQKGPIAGYLFAGSETLPAFDERCHLSRTHSGRSTEDIERSKSTSEQTMLHLRVRHESLRKSAQDLLISDIWGEFFKNAINSKTDAQKIKMLSRADHLVILVDGAKLADLSVRNQAVTTAKMTLRSFLEAEMIGKTTLVQVLFSKNDLIDKADAKNNTDDFLERTKNEIRRKFEHQVGRLLFHKIAARPAEGIESYGVSEIFSEWVEDSHFQYKTTNINSDSKYIAMSSREFDRYSVNRLPSKFT